MANDPTLICLFGGSFDPVHLGHRKAVEYMRRIFPCAHICLIPAYHSPLKQTQTSFQHRCRMLELGMNGLAVVLDTQEAQRPPPSFTIDTLRTYRHYAPHSALAWVMGDDTLPDFDQWKDWQAFGSLVHRIILSRTPMPQYPHSLSTTTEPSSLLRSTHGHILYLDNPIVSNASSTIRGLVTKFPQYAQPLLHPEVYSYIMRHHLYQH